MVSMTAKARSPCVVLENKEITEWYREVTAAAPKRLALESSDRLAWFQAIVEFCEEAAFRGGPDSWLMANDILGPCADILEASGTQPTLHPGGPPTLSAVERLLAASATLSALGPQVLAALEGSMAVIRHGRRIYFVPTEDTALHLRNQYFQQRWLRLGKNAADAAWSAIIDHDLADRAMQAVETALRRNAEIVTVKNRAFGQMCEALADALLNIQFGAVADETWGCAKPSQAREALMPLASWAVQRLLHLRALAEHQRSSVYGSHVRAQHFAVGLIVVERRIALKAMADASDAATAAFVLDSLTRAASAAPWRTWERDTASRPLVPHGNRLAFAATSLLNSAMRMNIERACARAGDDKLSASRCRRHTRMALDAIRAKGFIAHSNVKVKDAGRDVTDLDVAAVSGAQVLVVQIKSFVTPKSYGAARAESAVLDGLRQCRDAEQFRASTKSAIEARFSIILPETFELLQFVVTEGIVASVELDDRYPVVSVEWLVHEGVPKAISLRDLWARAHALPDLTASLRAVEWSAQPSELVWGHGAAPWFCYSAGAWLDWGPLDIPAIGHLP